VKKTSKRTAASPRRSRARAAAHRGPPRESVEAILAFAKVAKQQRVRWYVFGAQAVGTYAVPRTTGDIDITMDLGARPLSEFVGHLKKAKFELIIADEGFVFETRILPVIHSPSGWKVDLVLAGPGIEQLFLDEAHVFRARGGEIRVIAPEHLVAVKILAGRPKDLEDVRGLLRVAELDHGQVDDTLRALEQALDQSDLRPLYARLRAETVSPKRRR
jgi:hypothetical protein